MGALNWIVLVLVIFGPILVATGRGFHLLSFVIICCLLGSFSVRLIVAYRRRSKVKQWKLHTRQVNDSLYELHKPAGVPTIQVLFFHGLPFRDFSDTYFLTWESGDGSCIWPKTWLAKEFPDAHILLVSYGEGLKEGSAGSFDMRIIRENLTSDLMEANVGQTANCPVVLVGHSFGGLVIKDVCLEAHNTLISPTDKAKVQKFLDNLRGVFYYSTPHHGSPHIGRAANVLSGPFFKYFTVLSTEAARLNFDFNRLCNSYPNKLQTGGLGEQLPVTTGIFQGVVVVPEASARDGENFNLESSADHFSVCRPEKTTSRRFNALTRLLSKICDDLKDNKAMAQKQAVRQNLQHLPKQMINKNGLLEEVKSRLRKFTTLGFVGMGGLGKTTLAKAVFNELSPLYEYSCFVPDVKLIQGTVEDSKEVVWKHMHHFGRKVGDKDALSDMIGKELLLVLDDISEKRDITLLQHLVGNSSPQSRVIVTSRDWDLLGSLDDIYEVPLLEKQNAEKLFLNHACPSQSNLPENLEPDMVAVVAKCGGLPLTLEVLGSYLKGKKDGRFWKQTLQALEKAGAIQHLEKRLWAKLRLSYEGLDEVEQQMFLDATTFFSQSRNDSKGYISLRDAKAAWRKAYGTEYETLRWQTLVDRSLVYQVDDDESIRVHDQLLSLGRKIASDSASSDNGKCRVWEEKMASKLLTEDSENQDIHALRLSRRWGGQDSRIIHISGHTLPKLKKLQYLDVDGPLMIDGLEEDTSFPSKIVLLKCVGGLDTFDLALQDRLVVLHVSGVEVLPSCIGQLSALRIFIGEDLEKVPDEFGDLSQLEYLEFRGCRYLQSLPSTFGRLSQLEVLKFRFCNRLQLSETFGGLSNLKDLEFRTCWGLHSLPESFGHLSALNHLVLRECSNLVVLPSSFGSLSALDRLVLSRCDELVALPSSIGNLCALTYLKISHCNELHSLPDSFGNLCALNDLKIGYCGKLLALPNSFGDISALKNLKLSACDFEALPSSFGNLSTLRHVELQECGKLISMITFGQLSELQYLKISGNRRLIGMERLPESLAELTGLNHLLLEFVSIRSIPDFIRSMRSLHTLELRMLPYIKVLPAWLGDTGAAPIAVSYKMFEVHDGHFSCTNEEEIFKSDELISLIHKIAMEKVERSDYEGALADLFLPNLGEFEHRLQGFLLQERGIARRWTGDHQGALEDLTAALEVFCDEDAERADTYDCYKHRGYVNFLLGDLDGALKDGAMALKLLSCRFSFLGYKTHWISPNLGEELVTFMHFKLYPTTALDEQHTLQRAQHTLVMEMVRMSDFSGALTMWEEFDARVSGYFDQVSFLLERGVLKRLAGDLQGASNDLTATLEILSKGGDNCCEHRCCYQQTYDCRRHLGYVKYLMGDEAGARRDAERCLAMEPKVDGPECLGGLPVAFLEFRLKGREANEEQLERLSHKAVMEKVMEKSDFLGALAIWDEFDARVFGYHDRFFFLQERGILKRMAGDLSGALEDLTVALEMEEDYECLKHRGYVKHLMGDEAGARTDAERCLAMEPEVYGRECLGGLPVAFLEFRLKGRKEYEYQLRRWSHKAVMEKVMEKSDFLGALAIWDEFDARVFGYHDRFFFLQERGILKRMAGDLSGALEDLTVALEMEEDYECLKHRGYVKHLMGDEAGARTDAERCLAMEPEVYGRECLGGLPVAFLEFRLKGRKENEYQLRRLSHKAVMEKVMEKSDFLGALAIWDEFDARVFGYHGRLFFLQERGILKRMAGDLSGALEDLTAALEMAEDYACLKHRGFVKHLMGDHDGARVDAERCMAMGREETSEKYLGGLPVMFLEFDL